MYSSVYPHCPLTLLHHCSHVSPPHPGAHIYASLFCDPVILIRAFCVTIHLELSLEPGGLPIEYTTENSGCPGGVGPMTPPRLHEIDCWQLHLSGPVQSAATAVGSRWRAVSRPGDLIALLPGFPLSAERYTFSVPSSKYFLSVRR